MPQATSAGIQEFWLVPGIEVHRWKTQFKGLNISTLKSRLQLHLGWLSHWDPMLPGHSHTVPLFIRLILLPPVGLNPQSYFKWELLVPSLPCSGIENLYQAPDDWWVKKAVSILSLVFLLDPHPTSAWFKGWALLLRQSSLLPPLFCWKHQLHPFSTQSVEPVWADFTACQMVSDFLFM